MFIWREEQNNKLVSIDVLAVRTDYRIKTKGVNNMTCENEAAGRSNEIVIREFGTWEYTECDRCGCKFQVTRTEPEKIVGEVICEDCELYELGYSDGFKHGINARGDNVETLEKYTSTEQWVIDFISSQWGLLNGEVKRDSHFKDDLGADSFDMVELIMCFEDHFDCEIKDPDAYRMTTVQDVFDYIEANRLG